MKILNPLDIIVPDDDIVLDISQIKLALDMCLNYIKRKRD